MKKDSLGARMKTYENVSKGFLTLGVPKVIRLDMRAGHTFCRGFDKPFDRIFSNCMIETTIDLCGQIPGVVAGYTQSDEISLILNDEVNNGYVCFFEGNIEKIVSISASIATLNFNKHYFDKCHDSKNKTYRNKLWTAQFDSRVFCLPNVTELHNYILWRQEDATRNSIQIVAHANFTDKECHGLNSNQLQDKLMVEKGINWNNFESRFKRGSIILKENYYKDVELPNGEIITNVKRSHWVEKNIPILTKDTAFIPSIYAKNNL